MCVVLCVCVCVRSGTTAERESVVLRPTPANAGRDVSATGTMMLSAHKAGLRPVPAKADNKKAKDQLIGQLATFKRQEFTCTHALSQSRVASTPLRCAVGAQLRRCRPHATTRHCNAFIRLNSRIGCCGDAVFSAARVL